MLLKLKDAFLNFFSENSCLNAATLSIASPHNSTNGGADSKQRLNVRVKWGSLVAAAEFDASKGLGATDISEFSLDEWHWAER